MDTIITFSQFSNLVKKTKANYTHFDKLYRDKLSEFHRDELMKSTYMQYLNGHKGSSSQMVKDVEHNLYVINRNMEFYQDELTMYKHEMMKWRDISLKVDRAFHKLHKQIEKVWHSANGLNFGRYMTTDKGIKCNGYDTKLHLRITNYTDHGIHQIIIALVDKEFGTLTNEQVF